METRRNRIASWEMDELGNFAAVLESGTVLNLYPDELDEFGFVDGVRRPYRVGDRFPVLSWWKKRPARVVAVSADEVVAIVDVVVYPRTPSERRFKSLIAFDPAVDVRRTWGSVSVWCRRVYSSEAVRIPARYRALLGLEG